MPSRCFRYYLQDGRYLFSVFDDSLFAATGKHAIVHFASCGLRLSGATKSRSYVTVSFGVCAAQPSNSFLSSALRFVMERIVLITSLTVFFVLVTAGIILFAARYRKR